MKSCINGATTMPYSLEEDIAAAGRAGFEGVELWTDKVDAYLQDHSIDGLKRLLEFHRVKPVTLCPFMVALFHFDDVMLRRLEWGASVAKEIGCPTLLICPNTPPPLMDRPEAYEKAAITLGKLADLTAASGVRIAIEPLGGHSFIPGPVEAMEVIGRANHDHLGLMMDTFHYYVSGVTPDQIRAIPAEKLFVVHLNDAQDLPREELNDGHRIYMTLGVLPLVEELRILRDEIGYSGHLSVEIFCEDYWKEPVQKITDDSKMYYDRLMDQVNRT